MVAIRPPTPEAENTPLGIRRWHVSLAARAGRERNLMAIIQATGSSDFALTRDDIVAV